MTMRARYQRFQLAQALRALEEMYAVRREGGGTGAIVDGHTTPGWVVIASVDDYRGEPELEIHRAVEVVRWYRAAQTFLKRHDPLDYSMADALEETRDALTPVHPQVTSWSDGTRSGHVIHPRSYMAAYRQYCKYCHVTHDEWWMIDQRDYLVDGLTIILCGRCEHTSAQDHETRRHPFRPPTEAMQRETLEYVKRHGRSPSGLVEEIPRHREETDGAGDPP
jgi:hypothetical protein